MEHNLQHLQSLERANDALYNREHPKQRQPLNFPRIGISEEMILNANMEELLDIQQRLEQERDAILGHIEKHQECCEDTGDPINDRWVSASQRAVKVFNAGLQKCYIRHSAIKREEKAKKAEREATVERLFMQIAKDKLTIDMYYDILDEAEERSYNVMFNGLNS